MMKLRLVPNNPEHDELVVSERSWRPARSLMAIANQKSLEKNRVTIVSFSAFEDIDENIGFGLSDDACIQLALEMERLIRDPFTIVDYGMTIDIENGDEVYTYPTGMCTSYFEDVETGDFFESLDADGIVGRSIRSWFRTTKEEMQQFITFLKSSGGFEMP